jgi:flagellar FliJ protein
MAQPFSLQPLLQLAKQKNETAIKNLGRLNQQHQSALTKQNTLRQFRTDYQDKFQEAARNGMAQVDLRNFQDFIYRLDQAIKQQQGVIDFAVHSVNVGRAELNEAQRKMQSFDALAQRHLEVEKVREAKAEQKMQDENSGRFAAYRTTERNDDELEGANHE